MPGDPDAPVASPRPPRAAAPCGRSSGPLLPRLRASPGAGAFLDGVNAASLALMAAVTLQLGRSALADPFAAAVAAASALLLFRYRVNSAWLVLGSGAAGLAAAWLQP